MFVRGGNISRPVCAPLNRFCDRESFGKRPMTSSYMQPFTHMIDLKSGSIPDSKLIQSRRLSDLKGLFADQAAEAALLASNPLLYEVFEPAQNPAVVGQLRFGTTILYPGKVGNEYYMTKGHYHALGDRAEVYYGLMGKGCVLMQTPE